MNTNASIFSYTTFLLLAVIAALSANAQTRTSKPVNKRPPAASAPVEDIKPSPQSTPALPKRNERPAGSNSGLRKKTDTQQAPEQRKTGAAPYRYAFSQPEFVVSHITIEHDEAGAGTLSFRKKGTDESITDPITVSPKAIARIDRALEALNFLDSTESYQYEKDFSHIGNITFRRSSGDRTREVSFNWTENKNAKVLMDEYRRIGNQFVWIFDISLSRENQPLEAPRLLDSLDSLIRRNEISDPHQMEPFLRALSNDERIPLIARNHAARLVTQFEREKAKEGKKKPDAEK